jgi:hypothetical protein
MELLLKRDAFDDKCSLGKLYVDGQYQCETLEDVTRPPEATKVFGATAIPFGRYLITIERSPRFSELAGHDVFTPRLHNVPGYAGVLIHPGNTDKDTEGCILVGRSRGQDSIEESRLAYNALMARLQSAQGPLYITITT